MLESIKKENIMKLTGIDYTRFDGMFKTNIPQTPANSKTTSIFSQPKSNYQTNQLINDHFKGLEAFNLYRSGTNTDAAEITVNGEKVIVNCSNGNYNITRKAEGQNDNETLTFNSMDELTQALNDKNMTWGRSEGLDIHDMFIPSM